MRVSVLTPTIRPAGLRVMQECLARQTFQDFEWLVEVGVPERGYDLNRAWNRMLRRAKGELCIFYQDHIKIPDDGIEQFVRFSDDRTFITAPVGKEQPDGGVQWDWRVHPQAQMDWMRWEIDWGAAPLAALKEIGGFDEWLDEHTWTFDGVSVGFRAARAGYGFLHLPENKAVAFDHDAHEPHPFREKLYNPDAHNRRLDEFRRGLKVDYLTP